MAVNLLRGLKEKNIQEGGSGDVDEWFPKYEIDGDHVWLTEIYVRSRKSLCYRPYGCSIHVVAYSSLVLRG